MTWRRERNWDRTFSAYSRAVQRAQADKAPKEGGRRQPMAAFGTCLWVDGRSRRRPPRPSRQQTTPGGARCTRRPGPYRGPPPIVQANDRFARPFLRSRPAHAGRRDSKCNAHLRSTFERIGAAKALPRRSSPRSFTFPRWSHFRRRWLRQRPAEMRGISLSSGPVHS